jgi:hypothetical protein
MTPAVSEEMVERLRKAGCTSPDGTFVHASTEQVVAALSTLAPSAAPSDLDEAHEQIRDLTKVITELGGIVYAPGEPLTTWKARAEKAEAALAAPSAEAAQPVANSYTARNHLLSLVDSSNWPDMKGDYFKGYSDAMEIVNEAVLDCWDELKFEAGKPPSQPQGELREGMVLVPEAALKWLFGEGPDADGNWFGDGPAHATGAFWWRTPFRAWIDAGRTAG